MTTPNFYPDFKSSILGLSNDPSFDPGFLLEGGQKKQNVRLNGGVLIPIFQKILKVLKESQRFQKIPKNSERFLKIPNDSKSVQKVPKDSNKG